MNRCEFQKSRRNFLKTTGCLAVAAALPAVPAPEYIGDIYCGPVYIDGYIWVSSQNREVHFERPMDPTTWHS